MSQIIPEPQKGRKRPASSGDEEIYRQPYKTPESGNVPKDEHPSTFEASIPPYSYRAQDAASRRAYDPVHTAHPHETDERARRDRPRRFSPDGDARSKRSRPYPQPPLCHQVSS